METIYSIDVTTLDATHRQALEDVVGIPLHANQRLIIGIVDIEAPPSSPNSTGSQSLADWTGVYDGLSDDQIEEIDRVVKTRANLTRDLP